MREGRKVLRGVQVIGSELQVEGDEVRQIVGTAVRLVVEPAQRPVEAIPEGKTRELQLCLVLLVLLQAGRLQQLEGCQVAVVDPCGVVGAIAGDQLRCIFWSGMS